MVCYNQAHFEDDQFELNRLDNRKLLKWNAIPTLRTAIPLKSQGVKRKLSGNIIFILLHVIAHYPLFADEGDPLAEINDISEQQNLDQLKHLQDELNNTKTTVATLEHQLNDLEKQFTCIFTEDQIHIMKYGNHRAKEWSDKTIQRAFKLYMACGTKGYEELRRQNFPLPSVRTLQYRIENLNQVHWKMQSTKVEGTWEL